MKVHSSQVCLEIMNLLKEKQFTILCLKSNSLTQETFVEKAYLVRTRSDFTKEYIVLEIANIIADTSSASNITLQEYDEFTFYLKEILWTSLRLM